MISVVFGAGGFVGSHLVKRLKELGHIVYGIDRHYPRFFETTADKFLITYIKNLENIKTQLPEVIDEVYQLCADVGGSLYVDSGKHDADILTNNLLINISVLKLCVEKKVKKIFFSSSVCVYPNNSECKESDITEYNPINEYGWEKIYSEHIYKLYEKQYGMKIYIGRFFNLYGSNQLYKGGKEKFIEATCRKIIEAKDGDTITIYGSGSQVRSFLFITDCIEAVVNLVNSNISEPINIGSDDLYTINDIARKIIKYSGKDINIINTTTNLGGDIRNCNLIKAKELLDFKINIDLDAGIKITYDWIKNNIFKNK